MLLIIYLIVPNTFTLIGLREIKTNFTRFCNFTQTAGKLKARTPVVIRL